MFRVLVISLSSGEEFWAGNILYKRKSGHLVINQDGDLRIFLETGGGGEIVKHANRLISV